MRGGLILGLLLAIAAPAWGAGKIEPGAYCPFPEPGQKPACMDPARAKYGELFAALDEGEVDDEHIEALEVDVTDAGSDDAYLALSSLTYVYYTIARQAAAAPDADPVVAERLARLNDVLAGAYEAAADDPAYRDAMRTAARDLEARAPAVSLECTDASGEPVACRSTEDLLSRYATASEQIGIRGALRKILERFTGGPES